MPLTAYRDPRPGMTRPDRGCYPDEPDPRPGDEDYGGGIAGRTPWWKPRLLPEKFFRREDDLPMAPELEGRRSRTVAKRIAGSCAGWEPPRPTADEFYDALRAPQPTPRQEALVFMWLNEASEGEVYGAWLEGAYTWRILAEAARRTGQRRSAAYRVLNTNSSWSADLSMEETWGPAARSEGRI